MSLRDQLRARKRPTLDYDLPIDDAVGAGRALLEAQQRLRAAEALLAVADDEKRAPMQAAVDAEREACEETEAALDACYAHITLTAMKPPDYEVLVGKHPAREGTDDEKFNKETFPRACFLESATELSPIEWEEFLRENFSWIEIQDLFDVAVAVNERLVNRALPKGLMRTRS